MTYKMWFEKLKLLCWKNSVADKKQKKSMILELFTSICIIITLICIKVFTYKYETEAKPSQEFNINPPMCKYQNKEITKLIYSPNNKFYNQLMADVVKNFNVDLISVDDDVELINWIEEQNEPIAGVVFEESEIYPTKHLKYTIRMPHDILVLTRWNTDKIFYAGITKEARPNSLPPENSLYYSTCFLKLQNEIDQAFIKTFSNGSKVEKLKTLKTFPYPSILIDDYNSYAAIGVPSLIMVYVIISIVILIRNITSERESRLTESMKIMGLSSVLYWSSWFIRSFIILLIFFTMLTILAAFSVFANSNPIIVWIFFASYITSIITFCFLVSVVFKKSTLASITGSLSILVVIPPCMIYHDDFYRLGYGLKMLFSMLPNTNICQGVKMILMAEVNDAGVGFGNLFKRSMEINISFFELLFWMNVGSAIQMLLTILIEKVLYEEFEMATFWNIFVDFINKNGKGSKTSSNVETESNLLNTNQQEDTSDGLVVKKTTAAAQATNSNVSYAVQINDLTKQKRNDFIVKDISIKFKRNRITVLLGNDEAGQSTLVSMLTGISKPTSGTVIIDGNDITTNIDEARKSLSLCPQHDVFFENLTVQENLKFFCKLKGMTNIATIQENIRKYLKHLGLLDVMKTLSCELNSEQKRKLSIAIALCGPENIVIIEEPLKNIEPSSREQLINLLKEEKQNRTILITTSSTDDAEELGDVIAVMSHGELLTVESQSCFKSQHGIGYQIKCVKGEIGFSTQVILERIEKLDPKPFILSETNKEVIFVVHKDNIAEAIKAFVELKDLWNIEKLECNYRSFDDVFKEIIKIYSKNQVDCNEANSGSVTNYSGEAIVPISNLNEEPKKEIGRCDEKFLIAQQLYAMFLKKFWVLRESWKMFLMLGIISFIGMLLIHVVFYVRSDESENFPISLDSYEDIEVLLEIGKNSNISDQYIKLVQNKHITSSLLEESILNNSKDSLWLVNRKNLIAASFKNGDIIAWFNTQPYHTMPLTINTVNRAILKSIAGSDCDISVSNYPYPYQNLKEFPTAILLDVIFLMTIWPLIYVGYLIKERKMKFKFQQFISGANRLIYWFTNLVFDYLLFIAICIILFGLIVWLNFDGKQRLNEFRIWMILGSSYGFSMICFIYAFSYLFNKPSTGGIMLLFSSIIISTLSTTEWKHISKIGNILPQFNLVRMSQLGNQQFDNLMVDDYVLINICSGCFFFLIAIFIDCHFLFAYVVYKLKALVQRLVERFLQKNKDVNEEDDNKSDSIDLEETILNVNNLTKTQKDKSIINQLTFKVENDECFGILGGKDSGKSTIIETIFGEKMITYGDIWIKGKCLKTHLLQSHKFIGYCPQFDNCIPELTGRETLKIFALIRGIKMDEINELVNQMATELDFKQHLDKQVKAYSGGNRRKLSTALALLGNPELIFLDECTTGVDPQARRQIWNAIKKLHLKNSSSIVISSHSMDECEALCTRIGIIVTGQFQCLGELQYLKNKFSKGFLLTIKTGFSDEKEVKRLRELMVHKFLDIKLINKYLDMLVFHLKNLKRNYSAIFKKLEEIKDEMGIKDYKLSQMTLENFFDVHKNGSSFTEEELKQIRDEESSWKKSAEEKKKLEEEYEDKIMKREIEKKKEVIKIKSDFLEEREKKLEQKKEEIIEMLKKKNEVNLKKFISIFKFKKIKNKKLDGIKLELEEIFPSTSNSGAISIQRNESRKINEEQDDSQRPIPEANRIVNSVTEKQRSQRKNLYDKNRGCHTNSDDSSDSD